MLLKIITNRNTTKIITDIEDAQIHNLPLSESSGNELYESAARLPTQSGETLLAEDVEAFDDFYFADPKSLDGEIKAYSIDIQKGGALRRILIKGYAYLCNDEGKTIAKIGC